MSIACPFRFKPFENDRFRVGPLIVVSRGSENVPWQVLPLMTWKSRESIKMIILNWQFEALGVLQVANEETLQDASNGLPLSAAKLKVCRYDDGSSDSHLPGMCNIRSH